MLMLVIVIARCAERTVPNLLSVLCSNDMTARQHLESQQALFHQFAKIIDFTLKFDDLKVNTCDLLTLPAQYVEQGLCCCRASVCLSVCSIQPPHATTAGLLLWTRPAGDVDRLLLIFGF